MSDLDVIIARPVDVRTLLDELDLAEETLRSASFSQAKLFEQAARFYIQCMKERIEAEATFEEYKARRSLHFRTCLASRSKARQVTEKQITERVMLKSKYYARKQERYNATLEAEAYAKLLLEALKMRRDMIRSMTGLVDEEARAEFRELKARKANEEFEQAKDRLKSKYRHLKR